MTAMPSSRRAEVTLPADDQILITREFDAPRRLVYRAWTTPELVGRWWSGRRGEMTLVEMDFRVGGAWRYVMNARDGHEVGFHGEYLEIVPPSRLAFTFRWEEPAPDDRQTVVSLSLTDLGGTTELVVDQGLFATDARLALHRSGWSESLDRLAEVLSAG